MDVATLLRSRLPDDEQPVWDALEKMASPSLAARALDAGKSFASNAWRPGIAGAGIGAVHGFVNDTLDAREQGQGWGDAVRAGGRGALDMGAKGAVIGGGLGGAFPALGERITNLGKGTAHSLTGWVPKGGLDALQGGSFQAMKDLNHARSLGSDPKHIANLEKQVAALKHVETENLTNIPGMVKGLVTKPLTTLNASKRMLLDGMDGYGKTILGLVAAASVIPAVTAEDATLGERATMVARPLGSMLLTSPLGAMTSQGSANRSGLGMLESVAGNILTSSAGRVMEAPVSEAQRALSNRLPPQPSPTARTVQQAVARPNQLGNVARSVDLRSAVDPNQVSLTP